MMRPRPPPRQPHGCVSKAALGCSCDSLEPGAAQIDGRKEPGPAYTGNAYIGADIPEIPKTLREALDNLDNSAPLRAALGDDVVEHYLHCGRWEQLEYDRRITDHELIRGFERA
jgi:glutamine synthetase